MLSIDLNCDLGEGYPNDAELMRLISSANIACGGHAGDIETMRLAVSLAVENGVAIGAHPGYVDKENFGRTSQRLNASQVHILVSDQIAVLRRVCDEAGTRIRHVKPHGALYNQAAQDSELAAAIAEAVSSIDQDLIFYGLSGSVMLEAAANAGLRTAAEVFADRTYQNDGSLTPRTRSDALVSDEAQAVTQVLDMIQYKRVRTTDAVMIPIIAETVCIHGDGEHAVSFAGLIRQTLERSAIEIRPPFSR